MYDELIKGLRELAHEFYLDDNDEYAETKLKEAADAIEELLPFKKQVEKGMGLLDKADELLNAVKSRWIPVTERLPDGRLDSMGVYIKNVEMPTDHPLWIVVHSDGTVEANEVSASRPVGWQTLRNAAVPILPHGRLIDADELAKRIKRDGIRSDPFVKIVCDYLKDAPTIVEADRGDAQ